MKAKWIVTILTLIVIAIFITFGCGKREKTITVTPDISEEFEVKTSYDPSSIASHKVYSTVAVDFDVNGDGVTDANDKPKYMGSGACKVCHQDEYAEYAKTNHSWEHITSAHASNKTKDGKVGSCASCHSVGYSDTANGITEESGLNDPSRTDAEKYGSAATTKVISTTDYGLQGIGCESCHGPGSAHIEAVGKGKAPKNYINGVPDPDETCMRCHQSAYRSRAVMLTKGPAADDTGTLTGVGIIRKDTATGKYYAYPTHIRQAMFFEGVGGYEFPPFSSDGKSFNGTLGTTHTGYPDNWHTTGLAGKCITCHLFGNAARGGKNDATVHDLEPDLASCQVCHPGASSFDINGREAEMEEELEEVKAKLDEFSIAKCGSADCYLSAASSTVTIATDANLLTYARAYYNWEIVEGPGAKGIHNYTYAKKLLDDAYTYITCMGLGTCASGHPRIAGK